MLCAKAKVAKGRGALKPVCATPKQPTLLSVLREEIDQAQEETRGEGEEKARSGDGEEEEIVEGISEGFGVDLEKSDAEEIVEGSGEGFEDEESRGQVIEVDEGSSGEEEEDVVEVAGQFLPDHPFLVALRDYLTSRHGKGRSEREASQICSAVSQFLSFAGPELDPNHLYNVQKLDGFLRNMESQGKKPSTQHAKLCRIKQAVTYVNLSLDPTETVKAEKCLTLISNWLSTLGKEARRVKRTHLEEMSERGRSSMCEIDHFVQNERMKRSMLAAVESRAKGKRVAQGELRQIMVWLAGALLHCNAQRPGAVTNATLDEYQSATISTIGRDTYKTILVSNHKTATTGRARLSMDRHLAHQMHLFVTHIRPALEGNSSKLLFPNREGRPIDHLSRHVEKLAGKLEVQLPRTATETRHAAATAAAKCGDQERTTVATAMSHSKRSQEVYYTLNKGKKQAVEGYRVMEGIRRGEREGMEAGGAGSRFLFSPRDTQAISAFFEQHVSSRKAPSIEECREFVRQHPIDCTPKQVRDKVRNLIGRK